MKYLVILLLLSSAISKAENTLHDGEGPVDYQRSALQATSQLSQSDSIYPAHSGKSPKPFDKIRIPSDTFIVADQGPDNDVYKTRDDSKVYDLTFSLEVNRYVGNVETLKQNGLISETFDLIIPAYDVDTYDKQEDCDGDGILDNLNSEVDAVYLNGELVGFLNGTNEAWDIARNTFTLPIEKLKLPHTAGEPMVNLVQIDIDVANKDTVLSSGVVGCKAWATEIDYVAIDFSVVDPVIMLAGLSGKEGAFIKSGFPESLSKLSIANDVLSHTVNAQEKLDYKSCSNVPISFKIHANEFKEKIKLLAEKYGTNRFNLVTHSKGGLDSRYLINDLDINKILVETSSLDSSVVKNPIIINSIATLGTPFKGSAAASAMRYGRLPGVNGMVILAAETDYCDLDVNVASSFSKMNPMPAKVNFLAIGADIDTNNNDIVDNDENVGNQIFVRSLSQKMYDLIKNTKDYKITGHYYETVCGRHGLCFSVKMPEVADIPTNSPQYNDTSVSINSALPSDADVVIESDGNHATILLLKDEEVYMPYSGMQTFVIDEGVSETGSLKWRSEK